MPAEFLIPRLITSQAKPSM